MRHQTMELLAAVILAATAAAGTMPNVVLLSVDTLRADRLGCYGYPLDTSPHLDRFAEGARVFTDCVCEVPLTAPSMGSMLTSQFPRSTGTTRNGLRMPAGPPTVAEQFHAAGYFTFCVQSNWTLKAKLSDLDRGFDVYDDAFHKKRWGFIKAERLAPEVTRLALDQLAARPADRPFFAWIHYTDPHAPYKRHRGFNPAGRRPFWLKNEEKVSVKYDSEVAYTDDHIGQLLAALPENTAVVFVADHGESLYEHGYLGHGRRIYQTGLHIPLMVRAPGGTPGRSAAPARGIDIGPTLLGLAGLARPESMLGLDLLNVPIPEDRVRIVETYGGAVPKVPGMREAMTAAGPDRQGILMPDGWKLILSGHRVELFHLPSDPQELDNRAAKENARVTALRALIEAWDASTESGTAKGTLDEDDLKALDSLGYL